MVYEPHAWSSERPPRERRIRSQYKSKTSEVTPKTFVNLRDIIIRNNFERNF